MESRFENRDHGRDHYYDRQGNYDRDYQRDRDRYDRRHDDNRSQSDQNFETQKPDKQADLTFAQKLGLLCQTYLDPQDANSAQLIKQPIRYTFQHLTTIQAPPTTSSRSTAINSIAWTQNGQGLLTAGRDSYIRVGLNICRIRQTIIFDAAIQREGRLP